MTKVALSGASGNIGQVLRPALLKLGFGLRSAGGRRALTPLAPEEEVCHGDLRDAAFVDRLAGRRRCADPHGRHQRRAAVARGHREQSARPALGL